MPVNTRIQVRRGAASTWTSTNPTLYAGEIGYETDSGRFKIGDGTTAWTSLDYNAVVPTGFLAGSGLSVNVAADGSTVTYSLSDPTIQVSDITDFVDGVNDRVADLLTAGSNIQLSYTDSGNDTSTLSIAVTGVSLSSHTHTASNITDFNSSVSGLLPVKNVSAGSGVSVSSNNGDFTVSLSDPTVQLADITDLTSNARTFLLTPSSSNLSTLVTDETGSGALVFASGATLTNTVLSGTVTVGSDSLAEVIEDTIGSKVIGSGGIVSSYNDSTGQTTLTVSGIAVSGHTHTVSDITDFGTETRLVIDDFVGPGNGIQVELITPPGPGSSTLQISVSGALQNVPSIETTGTLTLQAPNVSTTGSLTVGGDLIVNGTTTTVNSTVTTLDDPILTLGGDTAPGSDDNKDRGIEFRYYSGSAKVGFFGYDDSTGKFTFIPEATNSSEVFSGTKGEVDANVDWSNILNKPDPVVAVNLTGDVTGSGNFTMTDLAGGTVNISTTVAANSVALGTDTTGDYVAAVTVSGVGLSVSGSGENATYNVSSNATNNNTASTIVARDSSGNFTASTITASGLSGVSANSPVTISYAVIDGGTP